MYKLQEKQLAITKTCGFHSEIPSLGLGVCAEVGELVDYLAKISNLKKSKPGDDLDNLKDKISAECADVLIYLLQIANRLDFDLEEAYLAKCEQLIERHTKSK